MRKQIPFMSFVVFLGSLVIGFPAVIAAQGKAPALVNSENGKSESLHLSKLAVDARIFGMVAETRMTMTFSNPHDRPLAGDLYFPLPEGATVSGYALDINGVMVDGVVVEKDKGRQVFESLTRKRIDPGLVEWVQGNNFKTRVFPIPAHGSRTIMVRYLSELFPQKQAMFYQLPLGFSEKINEFSLRVEVTNGNVEPKVRSGKPGAFAFKKWQQNFVAETKLSDVSLPQDLVIELPDAGKPGVVVEKNPEGEYHFLVSAFPGKIATAGQTVIAVPGHVVIFWDASASRAKGDHQREFEFLRIYFGGLPRAKIAVELIFFRNECEPPKNAWVENGNVDRLLSLLAKVDYDGGTASGSLVPAPAGKKPDQYLLFSDGISNFGAEEPAAFNAPLFVFSGDSQANHPFLHHLAESNNGRYFNLVQVKAADAARAVNRPLLRFAGSVADEKRIRDTFPRTARASGERFILAGKLWGEEADVTLNFSHGGAVDKKIRFRVSRANAAEGELLQTFWAQKKIEELMIFSRRNDKELVETGKAYGLVTPGTSLIVLDNLQQYIEHRIAPPKSLPEMRRQYMGRLEQENSQRKRFEADRLENVFNLWSARLEWWKTDFSKLAEAEKKKDAATSSSVVVGAGGNDGIAAELDGADDSFAVDGMDAADVGVEGGVEGGVVGGVLGGVEGGALADTQSQMESSVQASPAPSENGGSEPAIAIQAWDAKTPYVQALKDAAAGAQYDVYMEQRGNYGAAPGFFLDCADFFFAQKKTALGLRVLSNIAELDLEDAALLRILGHRLQQLGYLDLSAWVFEEVLRLRPEEPQSHRDLALVLAELKKYERAIGLLNHVAMNEWERFDEIELIALNELNNVIVKAQGARMAEFNVSPRLVQPMDLDIRIVMTWDADMTDIDLWVTEPTEEKAFYSHNRTSSGGLVSRDFTDGYGPEEYLIRHARHGVYKIQANYYGSSSTRMIGPVTVQVDVFTNWGRANEKKKSLTLRLSESEEVATIGEIEF